MINLICLLEKKQDLSRVSPVIGQGRWQVASLKLMWWDGVLARCTTAWWDGVLFSKQLCLLSSTQPIKAAQQPLGYFCSVSTHLTPALTFSPFLPPGPICSACVENFGARPVTVFSGVMVAGGLMLSAFAPNVEFLIFSYGIVVGA